MKINKVFKNYQIFYLLIYKCFKFYNLKTYFKNFILNLIIFFNRIGPNVTMISTDFIGDGRIFVPFKCSDFSTPLEKTHTPNKHIKFFNKLIFQLGALWPC